jgi:hypothetical protein
MRKGSLAILVLLGASMSAGCGGVASKPAPTLAQFAGQANQICVRLTQQQAAIEERARLAGGTAQAVWREVVGVSRTADSQVQALPRPPAEAHTIELLVAGYLQEADDEASLASAYASGDRAAVKAAGATFTALARADARVASQLGMSACAKAEPEPSASSSSD